MSVISSERYVCTLSQELQKKAHRKLNEPLENSERLECIDQLRESYKQTYPNDTLSPLEQSDRFLLMFLRVRKFRVDKAVQIMHSFIHRRDVFPEVFEKIDRPELLKDFYRTKPVTVLKGCAKNGSGMMLLRPTMGTQHPKLVDMIAVGSLVMQQLIKNEENQVNGLTFILDFKYYNFYFVKQMGPATAKKVITVIQDAMPVRVKNIFILNPFVVFKILYAVAKPFIKNWLKARLVIVDPKNKTLLEYIDINRVPRSYDGEADQDLDWDSVWFQMVFSDIPCAPQCYTETKIKPQIPNEQQT